VVGVADVSPRNADAATGSDVEVPEYTATASAVLPFVAATTVTVEPASAAVATFL